MAITSASGAAAYDSEAAAMQAYLAEGERKAFRLGNRGPIRFDANGRLTQDILDAYWRVGRRREARFQWNQSLTLNPEPEDAEKIKTVQQAIDYITQRAAAS